MCKKPAHSLFEIISGRKWAASSDKSYVTAVGRKIDLEMRVTRCDFSHSLQNLRGEKRVVNRT
jgi:hypothetical protein